MTTSEGQHPKRSTASEHPERKRSGIFSDLFNLVFFLLALALLLALLAVLDPDVKRLLMKILP
jgi:hypothetical protein